MNQVMQVRAVDKLSKSVNLSLLNVFIMSILSGLRSILCQFYTPTPPKELKKYMKPTDDSPEDYMNRASNHLLKAYSLYFEGIEDEACEEAWRATIDALNALSVAFWKHRIESHKGLGIFVDWLYEEAIADIRDEYGNASSLHAHYYHLDYLGRATIFANIQQVERLIAKIKEAYSEILPEIGRYVGTIPLPIPVIERR